MGLFKDKTLNDQRIIKETRHKPVSPRTVSMTSFGGGTFLILVCSFLNGSDVVPHFVVMIGLVMGTIMDLFAAIMFYEMKKMEEKGMDVDDMSVSSSSVANTKNQNGAKKKKKK